MPEPNPPKPLTEMTLAELEALDESRYSEYESAEEEYRKYYDAWQEVREEIKKRRPESA